MYKGLKKALFMLLLLSALTPVKATFCSPVKDLNSILAQIDAHIQTQVQKKCIPGCAVAIVYRNKVVFMHAYGVKTIGKHEKIDLDTVFQLGSVSKPIAATLASILEHHGLLRLEDPVMHYLPHFALKSRHPRHTLKIKHILSHSTGVPRGGFNDLIESHVPYDRILMALQSTPVRTSAGKSYDYNNAMYSLISDITHAVTRSSFSATLQTKLLQPLKMANTSATFSGLLKTSNRATPHVRGKGGAFIPCGIYSQGYYAVAPAGGINSSIRDMAVFLKAQLGGYPEVLNHRILSRIQTPYVLTNTALSPYAGPPYLIKNPRYALGWRVVDFAHHKLVFHGGWLKGFTNFIGFMPDQQIGIVILHNGESNFSSKTAVKLFELYMGIPQEKKKSIRFLKPRKFKKIIRSMKGKRIHFRPRTTPDMHHASR